MTAIVERLKQYAVNLGADLVGIASVDRFDKAPMGHQPEDILPRSRAVISCAVRIPASTLDGSPTAYHRALEIVHTQLDVLACKIALFIESEGGSAIPVPADEPYRHWESNRSYGRGDLSHKHAAQAAGLGRLGKNSLLITPQHGNRVHLVSVVTDVNLTPDSILDWEPCYNGCTLCIQACPAEAIEEGQVEQALCRSVMFERLPKGPVIESCRACRRVCPAGVTLRGANL
ncbi:MAG: epoxyqueuosine reductase [Dehalococcoidia bacterium]|nr:MAG: epoxyqueuosine reductase [Dehalococcoidia bacterium]